MDLRTYLSQYSGYSQVYRALHIAEIAGKNSPLRLEAFRYAIERCRQTPNTTLYKKLCASCYAEYPLDEFKCDELWVNQTEASTRVQTDRKEMDINQARNAGIRENMRASLSDLGDLHYRAGNLPMAIKTYSRCKELCTSAEHHYQAALRIVFPSLENGNWASVTNNAQKALANAGTNLLYKSKASMVMGVAQIQQRSYRQAAKYFLDVSKEAMGQFTEFMADKEVALYAGLCALASFERDDLRSKFLKLVSFKAYLDLLPNVERAVEAVLACRYSEAVTLLDSICQDLRYDYFLSPVLYDLREEIRTRLIQQFIYPFKAIRIAEIATAFNLSPESMEKELERLISKGLVKARIDSHNKVLQSRFADQRGVTFQLALETGEEMVREIEVMLLRASMLQQHFTLSVPRSTILRGF